MPVLVVLNTEIVRPPCVSVHTDENGNEYFTFLDREPPWYTKYTVTYVMEYDILSAAVPPRHKILSLLPDHGKNPHPFPRPALKVPKNQNPHKGR